MNELREVDGRDDVMGKRHVDKQDPLQGIGGPMTRARTRRVKEALNGLITQIQEEAQYLYLGEASGPIITLIKAQKCM